MSTHLHPKIVKRNLSSEVYLHLKKGILDGEFPPGTRLLEMEIAEQMGISRAPVREALRILEADHLLDFQVNQGAFVRRLTKSDIWDIYTARILVEGYIASLAAERAEPEDVHRLIQTHESLLRIAESGDVKETVNKDFVFHHLIWEISGHRLFLEFLVRLEGQIRMFMAVQAPLFTNLIDSVQDHKGVVDAIACGDADSARDTIQHHIQVAVNLTLDKWKD